MGAFSRKGLFSWDICRPISSNVVSGDSNSVKILQISSKFRLSVCMDRPYGPSVRTVRTNRPYGPCVRTVRTNRPYGPSVRTVRTDRPYGRRVKTAVRVLCWDNLLIVERTGEYHGQKQGTHISAWCIPSLRFTGLPLVIYRISPWITGLALIFIPD